MLEERPSYFLCNRRDVPALVKRAEAEATQILKEFGEFYKTAGVLAIEIKPVQCFRGYSISGRLTWNGETVIEESDCSLLFLTLNEIMLNRMLQLGMPSFGKGATQ